MPILSTMSYNEAIQTAIKLLSEMIATQSFSREEDKVADLMLDFFSSRSIPVQRKGNNIWCVSKGFDAQLPTILLNSHIDTVKPAKSYTKDPFNPEISDGKLYGLGSNDAGGPLVCLIMTFLHFYEQSLPFNLILAATAEEEISGSNGVASILPELGKIDLAIVGEPTLLDMAIAEKGLLVIDAFAKGVSGHAARDEGENAINKALSAIDKLNNFQFEKTSEYLGPIKKSVTMIEAGSQHNVVPDVCKFVIDVRTTDAYTNQETVDILSDLMDVELVPRSFRLNPSGLANYHPIVKKGEELGMKKYGSPTLSDQALMNFDTIKIGPGDSARSHSADEFIYLDELLKGIDTYIKLLTDLKI